MAPRPDPLFLERATYRRRRALDAVRLVVFAGFGLWMVPLLWPSIGSEDIVPVSMSSALLYVFGVWIVLIVVSALLSLRGGAQAGLENETGEDAGQRA